MSEVCLRLRIPREEKGIQVGREHDFTASHFPKPVIFSDFSPLL